MSFWLEATKSGADAKRLKYDLPDPSCGRVGPCDLKAWAKREGLEIDYIDNCYLKVPAERNKLSAFLTELYGPNNPLPAYVLSGFGSEWEFTIAAEEF
jgi:hypothetical protein